MKKTLSLMITLCMLLLILPLQAAAEAQEDAAKEATDAASLIEQATPLVEAEDYEAAFPIIQKAAETGDAMAQHWLGLCYELGLGVDQNYEEAEKNYQLAADQGYGPGICGLASCYADGKGVQKDMKKAIEILKPYPDQAAEWYLKALRAGYVPDEEDQKHLADLFDELYNLKLDFSAT